MYNFCLFNTFSPLLFSNLNIVDIFTLKTLLCIHYK